MNDNKDYADYTTITGLAMPVPEVTPEQAVNTELQTYNQKHNTNVTPQDVSYEDLGNNARAPQGAPMISRADFDRGWNNFQGQGGWSTMTYSKNKDGSTSLNVLGQVADSKFYKENIAPKIQEWNDRIKRGGPITQQDYEKFQQDLNQRFEVANARLQAINNLRQISPNTNISIDDSRLDNYINTTQALKRAFGEGDKKGDLNALNNLRFGTLGVQDGSGDFGDIIKGGVSPENDLFRGKGFTFKEYMNVFKWFSDDKKEGVINWARECARNEKDPIVKAQAQQLLMALAEAKKHDEYKGILSASAGQQAGDAVRSFYSGAIRGNIIAPIVYNLMENTTHLFANGWHDYASERLDATDKYMASHNFLMHNKILGFDTDKTISGGIGAIGSIVADAFAFSAVGNSVNAGAKAFFGINKAIQNGSKIGTYVGKVIDFLTGVGPKNAPLSKVFAGTESNIQKTGHLLRKLLVDPLRSANIVGTYTAHALYAAGHSMANGSDFLKDQMKEAENSTEIIKGAWGLGAITGAVTAPFSALALTKFGKAMNGKYAKFAQWLGGTRAGRAFSKWLGDRTTRETQREAREGDFKQSGGQEFTNREKMRDFRDSVKEATNKGEREFENMEEAVKQRDIARDINKEAFHNREFRKTVGKSGTEKYVEPTTQQAVKGITLLPNKLKNHIMHISKLERNARQLAAEQKLAKIESNPLGEHAQNVRNLQKERQNLSNAINDFRTELRNAFPKNAKGDEKYKHIIDSINSYKELSESAAKKIRRIAEEKGVAPKDFAIEMEESYPNYFKHSAEGFKQTEGDINAVKTTGSAVHEQVKGYVNSVDQIYLDPYFTNKMQMETVYSHQAVNRLNTYVVELDKILGNGKADVIDGSSYKLSREKDFLEDLKRSMPENENTIGQSSKTRWLSKKLEDSYNAYTSAEFKAPNSYEELNKPAESIASNYRADPTTSSAFVDTSKTIPRKGKHPFLRDFNNLDLRQDASDNVLRKITKEWNTKEGKDPAVFVACEKISDFRKGKMTVNELLKDVNTANQLERMGIDALTDANGRVHYVADALRLRDFRVEDASLKDMLSGRGYNGEEASAMLKQANDALVEEAVSSLMHNDELYADILKMASKQGVRPVNVATSIVANNKRLLKAVTKRAFDASPCGGMRRNEIVDLLMKADTIVAAKRGAEFKGLTVNRIKRWKNPPKGAKNKNTKFDRAKENISTKDKFNGEAIDKKISEQVLGSAPDMIESKYEAIKPELRQEIREALEKERKTYEDFADDFLPYSFDEYADAFKTNAQDYNAGQYVVEKHRASKLDDQIEAINKEYVNASTVEDLHHNRIDTSGAHGPEGTNVRYGDEGERISTITYKDANGDTHIYVTSNTPLAYSVMNNSFTRTNYGFFARMAAAHARLFRVATSTFNPLTWTTNPIKDIGMASVSNGVSERVMNASKTSGILQYPVSVAKFMKNPVKALKEMPDFMDGFKKSFAKSHGTEITDEQAGRLLDEIFKDIKEVGGENSQTALYREVNTFSGKTMKKLGIDKIVNIAEKPTEMWENRNRAYQGINSFVEAIDSGKDFEEAIHAGRNAARHATTNFSQSIGVFDSFRAYVPFMSARINGVKSLAFMIERNPMEAAARFMTHVFTPFTYCAYNNYSDDRKKAIMESLPQWYKDTHLILIAGSNVFSLPVPDEFSGFLSFINHTFGKCMGGDKNTSIYDNLIDAITNSLPVDVGDFFKIAEKDPYTNKMDLWGNLVKAGAKTVSSLSPSAIRPIAETATGKDFYTGAPLQLRKNSPVISFLAHQLGMNDNDTDEQKQQFQGKVYKFIVDAFGRDAEYVINAIDWLAGAKPSDRAGRSIADAYAKAYTGKGFDAARTDFYQLIDGLSDEKDAVREKLAKNYKKIQQLKYAQKEAAMQGDDNFDTSGINKIISENDKIISDYAHNLKAAVDKYGQMFQFTGGIDKQRQDKLIDLLNFTPKDMASVAGHDTYQGQDYDRLSGDERLLANKRYLDLGLPDNNPKGVPYINDKGQVRTHGSNLQQRIEWAEQRGLPRAVEYDIDKAIKGGNGQRSLFDIKKEYKKQISAIYDYAHKNGLKPDYDKIADIQDRFLREADARLGGIIQKYGAGVMQNYKVSQQLEGLLADMIPTSDYQMDKNGKFHRKPNMTKVDLHKWLMVRYGLVPADSWKADPYVKRGIKRIKHLRKKHMRGAARAHARRLNRAIASGRFHADKSDMNFLSDILGYQSSLKL